MNCIHCGAAISERQEICTLCGKYARVAAPEKPAQAPPAETQETQPATRTATSTVEEPSHSGVGFCSECGELVYLSDTGGCSRGHPPGSIRNTKDALGGLTPEEFFDKKMGTDNKSGLGKYGHLPAELKGWNWGAFFLTWIWGVSNGTWISLVCMIPYVGIVMPFVLGFKGNEWAWRNKKWNSIEHFRRVQRNWAIGGLIYTIATTAFAILFFVILLSMSKLPQ